MKYTTLIRLIGDHFYWDVPMGCKEPGHDTHCDCEVPKNWVFVDDVHDTYRRLAASRGVSPYYTSYYIY